MELNEAIIAEIEQEAAATRKVLERIPDDKFLWKPHEKSMPIGYLGAHIAGLLWWTKYVINEDVLNFSTCENESFEPKTSADLVKYFDENYAEAVRIIKENATDENLNSSWVLKDENATYIKATKLAGVRYFLVNHLIHHRAQLGVYLRLLDVPVPSTYGPSADEGNM